MKTEMYLSRLLVAVLLLVGCDREAEPEVGSAVVSHDTPDTSIILPKGRAGIKNLPQGSIPERYGNIRIEVIREVERQRVRLSYHERILSDIIEFTPHSLELQKDITLQLSYSEPDRDTKLLKVLRLDAFDSTTGEEVADVTYADGIAEFQVRRMGFYAVVTPITTHLSVQLREEGGVGEGLMAGTERGTIEDGWDLSFDRYLVAIGGVNASPIHGDGDAVTAEGQLVVDLSQLSPLGDRLWSFEHFPVGGWNIGYSTIAVDSVATVPATPDIERDDFIAMQEGKWSHLIEGSLSNTNGQSCPPTALVPDDVTAIPNGNQNADGDDCYDASQIGFRWGVQAMTEYGPCAGFDVWPNGVVSDTTDGNAKSLPSQSNSVRISLLGTRLFFNGFPTDVSRGNYRLLAQWLADCDLNLDGEVTQAELEQIAPIHLTELDKRFVLNRSPIPLNTMWDYIIAQLKAQGYVEGLGACQLN